MLAKKITKNQTTLPKEVVDRFTGVDYFEVSTDGTCITLRPLQRSPAGEVRARAFSGTGLFGDGAFSGTDGIFPNSAEAASFIKYRGKH